MRTLDPVFTLPDDAAPQSFAQAPEAVAHLIALYQKASDFLCEKFVSVLGSGDSSTRYRAFYPEVRITTSSYASVDSRLSFGHVYGPGVFATTITQPVLVPELSRATVGVVDRKSWLHCAGWLFEHAHPGPFCRGA